MTEFDQARLQQPGVGFAVYALDPHGPVTLEAHLPDGTVLTWNGWTAADCFALAFPPAALPPPAPERELERERDFFS